MKTKEITFTTIQQIKKNNKLAEQLADLEKIATEMYDQSNDKQIEMFDISACLKYFEDIEECTVYDFLYSIMKFAEVNQNLLMNNSKNLLK
jgi:hypothetical protein